MRGTLDMNLIRALNIVLVCRLILGVVFIYASYHKILDPAGFAENIHNFHAIPIWIVNLSALIIPWMELIVGIFLILGVLLRGATIITIGLYIFFIIILSQAVFRGIDVHCGCFKTEADPGATDLRMELIKRIVEDIALLGMAFYIKLKDLLFLNKEQEI